MELDKGSADIRAFATGSKKNFAPAGFFCGELDPTLKA